MNKKSQATSDSTNQTQPRGLLPSGALPRTRKDSYHYRRTRTTTKRVTIIPRNYDFYMYAHAEIIGTFVPQLDEHHHRQSSNSVREEAGRRPPVLQGASPTDAAA